VSQFEEVSQLFATYAWGIDTRQYDLLNSVFAADGAFVVKVAGGDTYTFEGRKGVVDFISSTTDAQTDQRRHVITNLRLDGDTATSTLTLHVVDSGVHTVKTCGVYTCKLVQEDGALRFAHMDLALDAGF
jgi:hypothetical protein